MTTSVLEPPTAEPTPVDASALTAPKLPNITLSDILDIKKNDGELADMSPMYRCAFKTKVGPDKFERCGSQTFVRIVFAHGDLLACAHHYHDQKDKLHEKALEVFDYRGAINKTSESSANV